MLYAPDHKIQQSSSAVLVNTINVVGTMGKGLALDMKQKFPEIEAPYKRACASGRLVPGGIFQVRTNSGQLVVNLATKRDWRDPSHYPWIGVSLLYLNHLLCTRMREGQPVKTLSMPLPGAGHGALDPVIVQQMVRAAMVRYIEMGGLITLSSEQLPAPDLPAYFAGVGARKTPQFILDLMRDVGQGMAEAGVLLRSGGAIGADTAFHEGVLRHSRECHEIFLPRARHTMPEAIHQIDPVFIRLAQNFHPMPAAITPSPENPHDKRHAVLALMARNGCQIFGRDFTNPSQALICWTEGGRGEGGTGQAIRLAKTAGIPVLDLGSTEQSKLSAERVVAIALSAISRRRASIGLGPHSRAVPESEVEPV